ncbi:MAG: hypothetical protein PHN72_04255 [Bacilli bacterium]|nr:hypothetical protein [Bacilli bacterium]
MKPKKLKVYITLALLGSTIVFAKVNPFQQKSATSPIVTEKTQEKPPKDISNDSSKEEGMEFTQEEQNFIEAHTSYNPSIHTEEQNVFYTSYIEQIGERMPITHLSSAQKTTTDTYSLLYIREVPGEGIASLLQDGSLVYLSKSGKTTEDYTEYLIQNNTCKAVGTLSDAKPAIHPEKLGNYIVPFLPEEQLSKTTAVPVFKEDKVVGDILYVTIDKDIVPIYSNTEKGFVTDSLETFVTKDILLENHKENASSFNTK